MTVEVSQQRRQVALGSALLAELARYAEKTYPKECCGILVGREFDDMRVIHRFMPMDNRWQGADVMRRFLIGGADLLAAERQLQNGGDEVLGFFHSHPDAAPRPSEFDRIHAWPWYTYLIAGIEHGRFTSLAGWQLRDDRLGYDRLTVRLGLPGAWHRPRRQPH